MNLKCSLILCLLAFHFSYAQTDTVRQRIFLVGDAGELQGDTHPIIDWLKKNVDWNDSRNTVIYLGDNIYPYGLPMKGEPSYLESKKILDYQIDLLRGKAAKGFFVPGNHDWANGRDVGWQRVQNQVNYINGLDQKNIKAWPLNGCPGPIEVELDDKVVLVFVDSQWFLHLNDKPGVESSCAAKTMDEFITQLQEIADRHPNQLLMLTMHHPMYTRGSHGGNYTWKSHIFPLLDAIPGLYIPLPIIGSIYPLTRGVFGNVQDVNHPLYRNMAKQIEVVLKSHPNAMQVAGHEHALQLLVKDSIPYIVSGSGAKLNRVSHGLYTRFAEENNGFALVEVRKSGAADIKFFDLGNKDLSNAKFSYPLKKIVQQQSAASIDTLITLPRTITIAANNKIKTKGRKVHLQGKNYRTEWHTPITIPVFDIKTEQGGLKVVRRTGTTQNKSLTLEDAKGKLWSLRSIEEFPQTVIPADLITPFAKDTISDALSATYPFAGLSIAPMEKAAGITSLRRKLVYVPNDPRLERYRKDFSATMAMLEELEPEGVKQSITTEELILQLQKNNDLQIDQQSVLKARLLDNFIMDFEREEDQWRWAAKETKDNKIFYPFSGDHNQAFFLNSGPIPRMLRKPRYTPEIQGFAPKAYNIKTFNRSARNFDHFFLNKLTAKEWEAAIDTFLAAMTEDVITQSLNRQPAEIQSLSKQKIINTLIEKKKFFKKDMMTYYGFLSRKIDVVGSNDREAFVVEKKLDGSVQVSVFKRDSAGKVGNKVYDRIFLPSITNEIRLYGLDNDDVFTTHGYATKIKIRMIGGAGNDAFINDGAKGVERIYDVTFEKNTVSGNPGFANRFSANPQVNVYNRPAIKYDYSKLGISIGFNTEDLLLIGPKFETIKQGFRKNPYGMRQYAAYAHSLTQKSYQFKYEADFTNAFYGNDLVLRANGKKLGNTNFFGPGNNTQFDGSRTQLEYYRAKYSITEAGISLRKRLQTWMQIYYGLSYQGIKLEKNANKEHLITNPALNGLNNDKLYDAKHYAGALFRLNINSKNNLALPTRGFVMDASIRPLFGLTNNSKNITQFSLDMATYISLFNYPRFVLATRLGYGRNVGKFEYAQAQFLGGNDNLRGYRRQRFAGQTMIFNNTELRFRVGEIKFYLLPGAYGVLAFHDIGRVQIPTVHSKTWHTGYGGGIWVSPIKRFVLTGMVSFSKEEKMLPLVKVGFQF